MVQRQYELYPYPDIDPDKMPRGMTITSILADVAALIWAGRKNPANLRVLDAGCGTGAPSAQVKLVCPTAHVVGIDLSAASLERARKRASRLGVDVEYHQLPIQDVAQLGQTFDYIVTSGVLHHMPDPAEGLRALRSVLDPQGAIAVMLYGTHGRVGIYALQEAMRLAADPDKSIEHHIAVARAVANSVPPWYPMFRPSFGFELKPGNDGGIVDLLLHVQDVHYDVDRVYELLEAADMRLHSWQHPIQYDLDRYTTPELKKLTRDMSVREREALAELLNGTINKQSFVAVRPEFDPPDTDIRDGKWRNLRAVLTSYIDWSATERVKDSDLTRVRLATSELVGLHLDLEPWQMQLIERVARIGWMHPLGELVDDKRVARLMPSGPRTGRDRLVEKLLRDLILRNAVALLERKSV